MNIQKELYYQEYVQREHNILHAPYPPELAFYSAIKAGNIEKTRELCRESILNKPGLGILSLNPLQNIKYHFVITAAVIARYCIEGGMEPSAAYSLSDFYILKADGASMPEEVAKLHPIMCEDYAKRMKNLRKQKICSKHVVECIDYIHDNLHKRITVNRLANQVSLNPSYLSRLFKQETGSSISSYIQNKKIETAQNMLIYSEFSPAQIASVLAFPSQSYFTEVFRKNTGTTPKKYRMQHLHRNEMAKQEIT